MEPVAKIPARIGVFLNAAVSYLTLITVALVAFSGQIGAMFPGETGENVATWVVRILSWIAGTVLIIRRVSPVAVDDRGMLPVDDQ